MKLTGNNRSTRGKTCPSGTLSTTNPTWTDPESNPCFRGGHIGVSVTSVPSASNARLLARMQCETGMSETLVISMWLSLCFSSECGSQKCLFIFSIDWIELAEDRDKWLALVNAVMNLRVP
jgi:hypothetical protein